VLLPWLPFRVPHAFLLWSGPILALVWIGCGAGAIMIMRRDGRHVLRYGPTPHLQCLCAGIVSFVLFALAARCASPVLPGGDEPRYLLITQSLLYDHDLQIENNDRRGDYRAYFRGQLGPGFVRDLKSVV